MKARQIEISKPVLDVLQDIANTEYRTLEDQIRFMIAQLYDDQLMPPFSRAISPVNNPVINPVNKSVKRPFSPLTLENKGTQVYRVMVAAARCKIDSFPITAIYTLGRYQEADLTLVQVGNSLSSLSQSKFLERVGDTKPAEYSLTDQGWESVEADPAFCNSNNKGKKT